MRKEIEMGTGMAMAIWPRINVLIAHRIQIEVIFRKTV